MKNLKPLLYILLLPFGIISVLFIITLFAAFTENKESVKDLLSMTGTLGDTLGGITTCLVSGLTLYYIITTFKDQNSINQHSKSANNFEIFYDILSKIDTRILDLSPETQRWRYEQSPHYQSIEFLKVLSNNTDKNIDVIRNLNAILTDLLFLFENIKVLNLEQNHEGFLKNEFAKTVNNFLNISLDVYVFLIFELIYIKQNPEKINLATTTIPHIYANRIMGLVIDMQAKFDLLVELGYLKNVSESEYVVKRHQNLEMNTAFQFEFLEKIDLFKRFDYVRNYQTTRNNSQ